MRPRLFVPVLALGCALAALPADAGFVIVNLDALLPGRLLRPRARTGSGRFAIRR